MRIGIISDTHGRLHSGVMERLRDVDCILHAGDFDDPRVMQELDHLAPVYGVRGNNDWGGWARDLPRTRRVDLGGVSFCMTHRPEEVPWNLTGVDVVVCGHTHQYREEKVRGQLWLNPGSCSYPRPYRTTPTMILMDTDEMGGYQVEKVELPL